jgi:hypothetical protein
MQRVLLVMLAALTAGGCIMHGMIRSRYFERPADGHRTECGEDVVTGSPFPDREMEEAERRVAACAARALSQGYVEVDERSTSRKAAIVPRLGVRAHALSANHPA